MQQDNDLQKLLDIASQKPDPNEKVEELNTVQQWILIKGIKGGDHVISPYEMWYSYKQWSNAPINFQVFTKQLKRCMHQYRGEIGVGKNAYYLVDPSSFDLTLDTKFKIQAEIRAGRQRREKRKNDKKKAQG